MAVSKVFSVCWPGIKASLDAVSLYLFKCAFRLSKKALRLFSSLPA